MTGRAASRQPRLTHGINVVALSGRRIDAADAPVPRFPLEHAAEVQRRISAVLRKTHAKLLAPMLAFVLVRPLLTAVLVCIITLVAGPRSMLCAGRIALGR